MTDRPIAIRWDGLGNQIVDCRLVQLQGQQAIGGSHRSGRVGSDLVDPSDSVARHEPGIGRLHIEDHRLEFERMQRADKPFVELLLSRIDFRLQLLIELIIGLLGDQSLRDTFCHRLLIDEFLVRDVPEHIPDDRHLIPIRRELAE